jgi:hypothetical protein
VRQFTEGQRRFRVVDCLGHGPAAALATARSPATELGALLQAEVVLRDGQLHGHLCGHAPTQDVALIARGVRALRHGARLVARLLDGEAVLRDLSRASA